MGATYSAAHHRFHWGCPECETRRRAHEIAAGQKRAHLLRRGSLWAAVLLSILTYMFSLGVRSAGETAAAGAYVQPRRVASRPAVKPELNPRLTRLKREEQLMLAIGLALMQARPEAVRGLPVMSCARGKG